MSYTRRSFLQTTLAGGLWTLSGCRHAPSVDSTHIYRPNVALIGCGGQGEQTWSHLNAHANVVALCDVDQRALQNAWRHLSPRHSRLKIYQDFRMMLERESSLEIVIIATPDHGHALQASWALAHGCHVFIEPPLTHTLGELKYLQHQAQRCKRLLYLGNQTLCAPQTRHALQLLSDNVLGRIQEVQIWTARPVWPQGGKIPPHNDPVPPTLNWDLWLCGAAPRLYKEHLYHRYNWRAWPDFGGGALGDIGCQLLSVPLAGLALRAPRQVIVGTQYASQPTHATYPASNYLQFIFDHPQTRQRPLSVEWYDGGLQPPVARLPAPLRNIRRLPANGCLLVAEHGIWLMSDEFGRQHALALNGEKSLTPLEQHASNFTPLVEQQGVPAPLALFLKHPQAACDAYSPPQHVKILMETVLIGSLAQHMGQSLTWQSTKQSFSNNPAANALLMPAYRQGWGLA